MLIRHLTEWTAYISSLIIALSDIYLLLPPWILTELIKGDILFLEDTTNPEGTC